MIQDIAPKMMYNQFVKKEEAVPVPEDTVFCFEGNKILCARNEDGELYFPSFREAQDAGIGERDVQYLFAIDTHRYYLYEDYGKHRKERLEGESPIPGYGYEIYRILRELLPKTECFAAVTAYHLYVWYRNSRYCGRCGTRTVHSKTERAMVCNACGNIIYPRISPAVIVGVIRGDTILVTRYAHRAVRTHALIAGFTEIGETLEETVQREVMEEVGLHVHNIRYFASQPWGFESDILAGFYCDADPDEEIRLDMDELDRAKFISRDEITDEPSDLSLTATMIMNFKKGNV